MKSNESVPQTPAARPVSADSNKAAAPTPNLQRREILKKMGRYGVYTSPAMLMLFEGEKAAATSLNP